MMNVPVLVIGLGSMGKRRIRNLQALGFKAIYGFDTKESRVIETSDSYRISCFTDFNIALEKAKPAAWIISVPPKAHHIYMKMAIELSTPFFVEASVVDTAMDELIVLAHKKKTFAAPSCTLLFHPAIKKIRQLLDTGYLGSISNVMYHMGNYLPDWHTYEKVSDFYVSDKETGGAREIVPFELTWITKLFGFPKQVAATVKKTIAIEGAPEIDDTYNCIFDYGSFTILLTVDVVSRHASRNLRIIGSERQLEWDWNENNVRVYNPGKGSWEVFPYETMAAAGGYNKNITEQMYIDEISAFFNGIINPDSYLSTLGEDHKVLKLLYLAEQSHAQRKFLEVVL